MNIKWFSWKRKNNIKIVRSKKDIIKLRMNKPFLIEDPRTGLLHIFKLTKWEDYPNRYKLKCSFINPNGAYDNTKYIRAMDNRRYSLGFSNKYDLCDIIKSKNFVIYTRSECGDYYITA